MKKNLKRKSIIILGIIIFSLCLYQIYLNITTVEIALKQGVKSTVELTIPIFSNVDCPDNIVLEKTSEEKNNNMSLFSEKVGKYKLKTKLFGAITVGNINVNVIPDIKLYPIGALIGIQMDTKGAIAVAYEKILAKDGKSISPAKKANIELGDVIISVNNNEVNNADEVIKYLNEIENEEVKLKVKRNGKIKDIEVIAVKANDDGKYKIGLWVRDNVAGVGTMTCVTENFKRYAALGHSINDMDTGIIMPVKTGNILRSELISVVKGETNYPGELKGIFQNRKENILGNIEVNDDYGIYGNYSGDLKSIFNEPVGIALQEEIEEGKAYIIATVDENGPEKYEVEVEKVNKQTSKDTKSMLIKVTDKRLLEKTGGIVQGMSGSPILQNNKIIGAITHVFVSNPTKGYGIFIEWMIEDLYNTQN